VRENDNMAKTQPTTDAPPAEVGTAKKPRILKFGILAQPATVPISGPVVLGGFDKMDVPFVLDGQRFVLPVSPKNPEWDALRIAFGNNPAEWTGHVVRVADGAMIRNVSIAPIRTRDGQPVE